ncbi:Uncharacterized protein APZ42_000467 [Daphnia magna]|uniref:Uncharacterized protein n=1 Tax=Daphnia magna TaxID=35525 RepID=A0A164JMC0_9CRUS|nr:Uncharacterized protein APZ42_000467 [Daphnia magna]
MFQNVGSETKLCFGLMRNQDPFLKWKKTLLDRCNLHERDCTCKIF